MLEQHLMPLHDIPPDPPLPPGSPYPPPVTEPPVIDPPFPGQTPPIQDPPKSPGQRSDHGKLDGKAPATGIPYLGSRYAGGDMVELALAEPRHL